MGVHWFAGTVHGVAADRVLHVVSEHVGLPVVVRPRGGYGYAASASVGQVAVYWSPARSDVFVSICGTACEQLGVPGLVALATDLDLEPSSRLDVAWDLDGITPGVFEQAFRAGDVVTRIHRAVNPETGRLQGVELRSNHEGDTVYLGSRSSERFVRVYDRRGPTRLELEWKGERALALWRRLLTCGEEDWSAEAMSELRAFLDFRDRSASVRPDCCPLLDWWEQITDGAGRECVTIPRAPRTLDQARDWLRYSVAPVLAMVSDGVQDWTSELRRLLEDGRERYTRRHDRVVMVQTARLAWGAA